MSKIETKPSKPFSNGTEYECFLESFCYRCKKGILSDEGWAELPDKGGCPIWDNMENARLVQGVFPSNDVVSIYENGKIKYFNVCKCFESDNADLMEAYKKIFEGDC